MSNKYSKWNKAKTYMQKSNDVINVFKGQESCFFQNGVCRVYLLDAYKHYNNSALDNIDFEILARVIASRVIVIEQLYCFLHIQGIDINLQELEQRLQILHSKGMITRGIIFNGKRKVFINHTYLENMEFFEPTENGEAFLKSQISIKLNIRKFSSRWTNIPWYEYVESCIMWNQIVLQLLLANKEINNFYIQFIYGQKKHDMPQKCIPLLINTRCNTYVFDFVRGSIEGSHLLEKWIRWKNNYKVCDKVMQVVFLCENEYHMNMMALYLKEIIDDDTIPIYLSHDDMWFGTGTKKIKKLCLPSGELKNSKIV